MLGVEFSEKENELYNLIYRLYIEKGLHKYKIIDPHISLPATPDFQPPPESIPYQNLLGCLMYISHKCRLDVSWPVATLSQFTEHHSYAHFKALMKALMPLGTTKNLGIKFKKSDPPFQIT